MKITYTPVARRTIKNMDHKVSRRISQAIDCLPDGDIAPMFFDNGYRLRVGKYRIIYEISGSDVTILRIGSRGDAYKGYNC